MLINLRQVELILFTISPIYQIQVILTLLNSIVTPRSIYIVSTTLIAEVKVVGVDVAPAGEDPKLNLIRVGTSAGSK